MKWEDSRAEEFLDRIYRIKISETRREYGERNKRSEEANDGCRVCGGGDLRCTHGG